MFWASTLTEFLVALEFWCDVNEVKKHDAPSRERLEQLKRQHAKRKNGKAVSATEWLAKGGTW